MARGGGRQRRVNEALREVLAEAVRRSLSDPRLATVTVTEVRATQDLKEATVFWTVLNPKVKDGAAAGLESARGVLQGRVARELRTRETPQLRFAYDQHHDDAVALTQLIDTVTRDVPPPDDEPDGAHA